MPNECSWPRCPCKGTGQQCEQRRLEQAKKPARKSIRKVSKKAALLQPAQLKLVHNDASFYMIIWLEREHKCQNCGDPIYEFSILLFHHILPKRSTIGGYPQYRYCRWNIWILCWRCHDQHDSMNPDSVTILKLRTEYHRLLTLHENGQLEQFTTADFV